MSQTKILLVGYNGAKIKNKNELSSEKTKSKPNVRRIGHNYERKIVKEHKEIGYQRAATTRLTSRIMDDAKIDINNVPFNIQCKSVRSGLNVFTVLNEMEKGISDLVPERNGFINLVFHKKESEEVVILKKSDWYLIIKKLLESGLIIRKDSNN